MTSYNLVDVYGLSSEGPVDIYQTARLDILEDSSPHSHDRENIKTSKFNWRLI
jgi:hypothetical protein